MILFGHLCTAITQGVDGSRDCLCFRLRLRVDLDGRLVCNHEPR